MLLEQLGLPIPAAPVLLLAGAAAVAQPAYGVEALAASVSACLIANSAWYAVGRKYGSNVLRLICRVSLSPDSCVRQTESVFERRGSAAILTAKFIPGLTVIAPPMAAALGVRLRTFALYNTAGALLYCGALMLLGAGLHNQLEQISQWLHRLGARAVPLIGALVASYVAYRAVDRWLFLRKMKTARINVQELARMIKNGDAPVILDVRSHLNRTSSGRRIPGARHVDVEVTEAVVVGLPTDRDLVVYCACPNEASAAKVALLLRRRGFKNIRPLLGGIDAWILAGEPTEPVA